MAGAAELTFWLPLLSSFAGGVTLALLVSLCIVESALLWPLVLAVVTGSAECAGYAKGGERVLLLLPSSGSETDRRLTS